MNKHIETIIRQNCTIKYDLYSISKGCGIIIGRISVYL